MRRGSREPKGDWCEARPRSPPWWAGYLLSNAETHVTTSAVAERHASLARWVADVATAFLQGDPQKKVLWARIPKDACDLIGARSHPLDTCLFSLFDGEKLGSLIGPHVDDMLGTGDETSERYQEIKKALKGEFNFKHWTEETTEKALEFCGCRVERHFWDGCLQPDFDLQKIDGRTPLMPCDALCPRC